MDNPNYKGTWEGVDLIPGDAGGKLKESRESHIFQKLLTLKAKWG